jgi:hypothetical protein
VDAPPAEEDSMADEADPTGASVPPEKVSFGLGPAGTGWRASKWLALSEFGLVVLIFIADWRHLIPFSKLPFLFLLGWASLRLRGIGWRDVGLKRFRSWGATLAYGTMGGLGLELLQLFVTQPLLVKLTGKPPNLEDFRSLTGNPMLLLFWLVLVWVLGGFGEEMVYRGYLMSRVAGLGHGTRAAWIASLILVSTLFALAHSYQGITGVIEAGIDGLLLGLMYLGAGRNLSVPIVAHGLQDTVDLLLIFLGKYPGM